MLRLNFVLIATLVISAIALVSSQHRSRALHTELERELTRMRVLETEWGQLQIEQGSLAAHARIASLAESKLKMRAPERDRVIVIDPSEAGQ
ncbi:MAG: cell division protein FtsL [Methyloversatilis sp.]|uniref:cell division protein FtsL n=1 Tax=Methyloversatilis TaxID=378210 RepID=UPI0003608D77|nr:MULTISPECIES: cell division protein FtsL [Methyloversatilis]MCR6665569.1 cell division protein FtsL [Methyloversatilis sp.]PZU52994.1 MAG: cell division protein FtsL [Thauera sp.]